MREGGFSNSAGAGRPAFYRFGPALAAAVLAGFTLGVLPWRGGPDESPMAARHSAHTQGYRASELLLNAAANLTEERGLVYTALQGGGFPSVESRAAIRQKRELSNQAFREALYLIRTGFAAAPEAKLTRTVEYELGKLEALRESVDRWQRDADDPGRPLQWFSAASRLMVFTGELMQLVHSRIRAAGVDPSADAGLRLQHLALVLSDLAGRERALISGAITRQQPLSGGFLGVIFAYRGRINGIWRTVETIAAEQDLSPEVRETLQAVKSSYFDDLERTRRRLRQLSEAGAPYTISAADWFEQSTRSIARMIEMGSRAGRLARRV